MQANELRIGNFVIALYEDANIEVQVCGIYAGVKDRWEISFKDANGWSKYCKLENVQPIPLTEEGLLLFGFEKTVDNNRIGNDWFKLDSRIPYFVCFTKTGVFRFAKGYNSGIASLRFVHQLQNLYFALTGKELELKKETA